MYDRIDSGNENFVTILEAMIGHDKIVVDDEGALIGIFKREKQFLNIKNYRRISDERKVYKYKNIHGTSV